MNNWKVVVAPRKDGGITVRMVAPVDNKIAPRIAEAIEKFLTKSA